MSNATHTLKLYGKSVTGGRVAAVVKMVYSAKTGVTVKVSVRTDEAGLAAAVVGVLS
jgi:coatomer subunit gamma